jgi:hypothetical protein
VVAVKIRRGAFGDPVGEFNVRQKGAPQARTLEQVMAEHRLVGIRAVNGFIEYIHVENALAAEYPFATAPFAATRRSALSGTVEVMVTIGISGLILCL